MIRPPEPPPAAASASPPAWRDALFSSQRRVAVFARYVLSSLTTAAVDYLVFLLVFPLTSQVLTSVLLARAASVLVNYLLVRFVVFFSRERALRTFPRFIAVVIASGLVTSGLIGLFTSRLHLSVVLAKMAAELLLYLVNFTLLERVVFRWGQRR